MEVDLQEKCNEAFLPILHPWMDQFHYIIMYGGAGSSKSVTASMWAALRCLRFPEERGLIVRKVKDTLRNSCHTEIVHSIERLGLEKHFQWSNATSGDLTISAINKSRMFFAGMDKSAKLKSFSSPTFAWVEEAPEISLDEFSEIEARLRGITNGPIQILLTFNPVSKMSWVYDRFFKVKDPRAYYHHSTYKDNRWVGESYGETIAQWERTNPSRYRVYGLGEWGVLEGLIYPNVKQADAMPESAKLVSRGLDFGYNDPCVLVSIYAHDFDRQRKKGTLYVEENLYERELTTAELIRKMDVLDIAKSIPIYCDHEGDRIKALREAGYNAKPATKGNVKTGIDFLQSCDLKILSGSPNLTKEIAGYCWELDSSGKPVDKPIDDNDHAMDATRYGIYSHFRKPPKPRPQAL